MNTEDPQFTKFYAELTSPENTERRRKIKKEWNSKQLECAHSLQEVNDAFLKMDNKYFEQSTMRFFGCRLLEWYANKGRMVARVSQRTCFNDDRRDHRVVEFAYDGEFAESVGEGMSFKGSRAKAKKEYERLKREITQS